MRSELHQNGAQGIRTRISRVYRSMLNCISKTSKSGKGSVKKYIFGLEYWLRYSMRRDHFRQGYRDGESSLGRGREGEINRQSECGPQMNG